MAASFAAREATLSKTTVKQHGFVVKGRDAAFPPRTPPSLPAQEMAEQAMDEGPSLSSNASGLTRESLGLLGRESALSGSIPSSSNIVPCSVSPGLPRVGDVRPAEYTHLTPGVKKLMRSVMRGLKAHQEPEQATEGLGGTYFFRNEAGAKIAIMKPCDEEPLAPNNPKGFVGRKLGEPGLKPTVRVGEAASREVAAYLLDHEHFAKVPHTVIVRMAHPVFHVAEVQYGEGEDPPASESKRLGDEEPVDNADEDQKSPDGLPLKLGSLQEFVPHECDTSEMGASRFSARDVQRIGILDIRLFNTDRHAGNILVRRTRTSSLNAARVSESGPAGADVCLSKEQYELIPIDHGFALPEALEPPYFEWQHWPQAMMPFGQEELEYIARLDPKADADLLRRELPGIHEESLRLLEVSTTLLKRCAAAGLSLSEIAGIVSRPLVGLEDEPSALENICEEVRTEIEQDLAKQAAELDAQQLGIEEEMEEYDPNADIEFSDLQEYIDEEVMELARRPLSCFGGDGSIADDERSPSARSATTHFGMTSSLMGSDASRQAASIDDALFSMDEDGSRTPVASSPRAGNRDVSNSGNGNLRVNVVRSSSASLNKAPSLIVKRTGEVATPGAVMGMSFGSALASGVDSLPASLDSQENSPTQDGNESSSTAEMERFHGRSSTYVPPSGFAMGPGGAFATSTKSSRRATKSGRRRGTGRKSLLPAYPPLVEPRGAGTSVFSGLNEMQWTMFMNRFMKRINEAIESGCWSTDSKKQSAGAQLSCPRF